MEYSVIIFKTKCMPEHWNYVFPYKAYRSQIDVTTLPIVGKVSQSETFLFWAEKALVVLTNNEHWMFEKLKMNDKEFEVVKNLHRCTWKGRITHAISAHPIELLPASDGEDEHHKRLQTRTLRAHKIHHAIACRSLWSYQRLWGLMKFPQLLVKCLSQRECNYFCISTYNDKHN